MTLVGEFKEIGTFLHSAGNMKLYNTLIAIQEKDLEIMDENRNLREEVIKLKESLKIKGQLKYENNIYWQIEGKEKRGPFCPKCWDDEKKLIHFIVKEDSTYWRCPKCNLVVKEKNAGSWVV